MAGELRKRGGFAYVSGAGFDYVAGVAVAWAFGGSCDFDYGVSDDNSARGDRGCEACGR